MRVLGIDPGTRKLGWGVVERSGAKLRGVAAGVVSMDPKTDLRDRLAHAFDQLEQMIEEHDPDVVAVEDIFFAKFASAAIKLGHIRGVVLLAAARADKPVSEWPPSLVKRTVAGRGAAEKSQVGRVVAATLGLAVIPPVDAADALAIAITHLASTPYASLARAPRASIARAPGTSVATKTLRARG